MPSLSRFLGRLRRLGEVTGELHGALASDSTDPDFAPEEPSAEALALLTATVDEEIEAIFLDLPDIEPVAPIAGRGEEVRDRLRLFSHVGAAGRVIRHHGDYHLGQVLFTGRDFVILDFEGDYPGTTVVRLEQNYRSTKKILSLAAGVIAYNRERKEKTLWTENPEGEKARVYRAWDEHEEANFVAQQTRHIGIRLALGAQPTALKRMFVLGALARVAIGVVVGLVAAFALTRLMSSLLFGIGPLDAPTYLAALGVLLAAAAFASYMPARRAASIDPVETLKTE